MIFLSSKRWTKCIWQIPFGIALQNPFLMLRWLKVLLLIAHSAYFQTFPACNFLGFARRGNAEEMVGWWCLSSSVYSPGMVAAGALHWLLSGRVLCLSWQKSNENNCIDYTTTLLSLEMSLCLPLERWNYRNRRETVSDLWWKIYNKVTLEVHYFVIRYKKIISGFCFSFLEV